MLGLDATNPAIIFTTFLFVLLIVGLVISVHEAAHAFMANYLGDPTARLQGRMSLNPFVHIDPIGTIVLPFILILLGGPVFGWAKPTPINPLNFKHPFRDSALSAFAGPASNFLLAIIFSIIFRFFPTQIIVTVISINLLLGIFNLIPIPPLDGYKVVLGILPKNIALRFSILESYGLIFQLGLLLLFFMTFSQYIFLIVEGILGVLI